MSIELFCYVKPENNKYTECKERKEEKHNGNECEEKNGKF